MHNLESILENETHKILSDFEIKTDDLILARQPDLEIFNKKKKKKKLPNSGKSLGKIKRKQNERYAPRPSKMVIPIVIGLVKELGELGIRGRGETIQTT